MPLAADYPFLDVVWTISIFFVGLIWLFLLIKVLAALIFRRHDLTRSVKAVWLIFVMVLPFLGVLVYLIAESRRKASA